jgi:predicted RNase H-like HicB family nuclease
MKHILQFKIYKGEDQYVGEGIDLPIVTQGKSIDEVVSRLNEALQLHLEGENLQDMGLVPHPSAMVNLELETAYA